jgi:hypothetical protein
MPVPATWGGSPRLRSGCASNRILCPRSVHGCVIAQPSCLLLESELQVECSAWDVHQRQVADRRRGLVQPCNLNRACFFRHMQSCVQAPRRCVADLGSARIEGGGHGRSSNAKRSQPTGYRFICVDRSTGGVNSGAQVPQVLACIRVALPLQ